MSWQPTLFDAELVNRRICGGPMRNRLAPVLLCLLVPACSPPNSYLVREIELPSEPDFPCIKSQLEGISNDQAVQEGTGAVTPGTSHSFIFQVRTVPHSLNILVRRQGRIDFNHVAWAPNVELKELVEARASLDAVEKVLSGRCGLGNLQRGMRETCVGTNCNRLQPRSGT